MTERIINQPEIIKPEFYLEKIGEGGIEFVEQFLKTPGTLTHSVNTSSRNTYFFLNLLEDGELSYYPENYSREIALSLYFTDIDGYNPLIYSTGSFGVTNINHKGFIIFNNKAYTKITGEEFVADDFLDELIWEFNGMRTMDDKTINEIIVKNLEKANINVERKILNRPFELLNTLKTMKGLRQLRKYNYGDLPKNQFDNNLLPQGSLKDEYGIRLIGFNNRILTPLPIRINEISHFGYLQRERLYPAAYYDKKNSYYTFFLLEKESKKERNWEIYKVNGKNK